MVADFSGEIGRCLIENWAFPLLTSDRAWDNFPLARQRNVHCPSFPFGCSWVPPKHLIDFGAMARSSSALKESDYLPSEPTRVCRRGK